MKDLPIALPQTQTSSETLSKEIVNSNKNDIYFHRKYSLKGINPLSTSPRSTFSISNFNNVFPPASGVPTYLSPVSIGNDSVNSTLKKVVVNASSSRLYDDADEYENAFFVADLGDVTRQYHQWRSMLSRVEPFYGK